MSTPPQVVAINKAVADILGEYKTPRPDPDQTLTHLTGKLKAARVTNNELKAATEASGVPKQLYGGLAHLEALVEKKCGKQPGFFNTKRKEAEVKQKTVDLTKKVEEERKEKIDERHERTREKKSEQAEAAHKPGNANLGHYDPNNLIALAREQAGKYSPPVRNSNGSILSGVAMAAAVFDSVTNRYFVGKSGHDKRNTNGPVPTLIWQTISSAQVDVKEDAFGMNCAEVHCLIKAFEARTVLQRNVTSLSTLTFVAYKVGEQAHRGPCKTCKSWIQQYGAQFL